MPTNNCTAAIKKLLKNYDKRDVYEALVHVVEQEDNVHLKLEEIKYNPRFWPK